MDRFISLDVKYKVSLNSDNITVFNLTNITGMVFLKSSHAVEVWKIQEISQYVNQAVVLDLVARFVICCKICSIWDLTGFHFLVPE